MLLVLSPSKTLDYESALPTKTHTQPAMLRDSETLVAALRKYTPKKLSALMDISDKLAALNVERYKAFSLPFTPANARPAILAFKGDVYEPLPVEKYREKDFTFAQGHVRILSGLYGVLKPLDLIQPYRLEMGTRLKVGKAKDLYAFWGDRITDALSAGLEGQKDRLLVNLASEEYFSAVRPKRLDGKVLNIVFKENQKGALKIIGLFAKKARGMMTDFVIQNHIIDHKELKDFNAAGYAFQPKLSGEDSWVFTR